MLAHPNERENARLGMIIARKHVKRAVDRNQIRRFIRQNFRLQQDKLKGLDLVVLARCNVFEYKCNPNELIEQQWQEVIQRWKKL